MLSFDRQVAAVADGSADEDDVGLVSTEADEIVNGTENEVVHEAHLVSASY